MRSPRPSGGRVTSKRWASPARFENVNIANPEFFKDLESMLNRTSLEDIRTYLAWHITHANVRTLPSALSPRTSTSSAVR